MQLNPDRLLAGWFNITRKFSLSLLAGFILLAALSLVYTVNNLSMNTDTRDMLSPELIWRQLDLEYEKLFPHSVDDLLIILEAETPDQVTDAARALYPRLQADSDDFLSVYSHSQLDFIRESGLLYLDTSELQDLADQLAVYQPFLSRLLRDQNLRGFSDMLAMAIEAVNDGEDIDLAPVLDQFDQALVANRNRENFLLSWQNLLFDDDNKAVYREFIVAQPRLDYSGLLPATSALESIRSAIRDTGIAEEFQVEVKMTGNVALAHEELVSVMQTNTLAIIAAFVFVGLILTVGLGSVRLVLATLLTLVTGLILTAGFATLTVGQLNLISVAFAVLYIGLGVDFAIHYCLRYREHRLDGLEAAAALKNTTLGVGSPLIICAVTTAIGFYAFIPTDYHGVAELGWISGSGMFISLITTLTFLPALLWHLPATPVRHSQPGQMLIACLYALPARYGKWILVLSALAAFASVVLIRDLEFDSNTLNLQPPGNASVIAYKELLDEPGGSPLTAKLVANGIDDARRVKQEVGALPLVNKVIWLHDFIPDNQDEKLAVIDEINLLLGIGFFNAPSRTIDSETRQDALLRLSDSLESVAQDDSSWLLTFRQTLNDYLAWLSTLDKASRSERLMTLEQSLLTSLPGRLQALESGLQTGGLTLDDLPGAFVRRWKSSDRYLMDIYPQQDLYSDEVQLDFVKQIQAVDDRVTGGPVITVEAGEAVITAFTQAFISATAVIALLLLVLMPRRIDAVLVLIPLLLAALLTAAISVLAGIPLNFANVIALPLLLGIGVDSAIHIMHRYRTHSGESNLLATSSARAILISGLTTIGSIGNLAFSPHLGTASMGMLLTIGIAMALLTTLFILPSLLEHIKKKSDLI
jgi:hypothetical protein